MNILFINSASRGFGGNERSITMVANMLSISNNTVFAYRKDEIGAHARMIGYQLPFLFEGDLYTIARLVRIVKKHRIDIIIPSKRKDYAIAGIVSRICGIRNILWLGIIRPLENTSINRIIYDKLADGIIVNAQEIKKQLLKTGWIPEKKIKVLYRGIDSAALDKVIEQSVRPAGPTMKITAMGRLTAIKSYDLLLKGLGILFTTTPEADIQVTILGEGNERSRLEHQAKQLGIEKHLSMPGFSSNPYPTLATSDVFVMTSTIEGLSTALVEAMYLKNAPVSTYGGGGVCEIITDGRNGFLFNHGDEETLASVLRKLYLEPGLRHQIAEAAQESVKEKYSAEKVKEEMTAFCQQVMNR
ncbi:glycosyltransferase [Chlorobium phaeovibrioides]|uniref:Glycosyltransferase n=1 Tax=Chlorobium phaeovibrioides TaxID=1094 RepID=A0A5M8IA11_CHLPH|nr:glycosyltransferase [Chlorobium phaeovibrioides]KAA6232318.1 glycosyltransferase [Chlorobium phaeovibrioides]